MTATVICGHAGHLPLPDASVDLIVTSPPYFGLRDYGYPGQIGSEATPQEWLANLVECTREWVRVLKPSGSMFVNLGDKYAGSDGSGNQAGLSEGGAYFNGGRRATRAHGHARRNLDPRAGAVCSDGSRAPARAKSLLGLPWRYAIACMDELGLILRRDIVWAKPNGLPESVTDRCRSSHEYLFHLVTQPRYYAAVDEIREPHIKQNWDNRSSYAPGSSSGYTNGLRPAKSDAGLPLNPLGKLPGSVWSIPSQPLIVPPELGIDHFAAFPMELPRRCILGWSPPGVCTVCGEGRRPVVTGGRNGDGSKPHKAAQRVASFDWAAWKQSEPHTITGYACACPQPDAPTRPAIVLDPFGGTGTTALVASVLGRHGVSVDLSADYCRLARWRTRDRGEIARAMEVPKPPPVSDGQAALFEVTG